MISLLVLSGVIQQYKYYTVFKVKDYYALILSILIPGKFDAGFLPRLMIVAIIGTIYVDEKLIHY